MSRVVVIGLDGLEPSLAFERYAERMPSLHALARSGSAARLTSCEPPITVPAWACMVTGRDPGALGLYGFNDRSAWTYHDRRLASSWAVTAECLWQMPGVRSRVIGVPPSYPARPLDGAMVTCFLTPDDAPAFTYPAQLSREIADYRFDTPEFRVGDEEKLALRDAMHAMIDRRFALARDWIGRNDWDLFMMVEMASDRAHHAFYRFADPTHPRHVAGHVLEDAIADIYAHLDDELGRLLGRVDAEFLVVSDHGACAMRNGFAINDWLVANGWLTLKKHGRFTADNVDWSRTSAWADGGYVGRVHFNMRGREPQGIVEDAEALARAIAAADAPVPLVVKRCADLYSSLNGFAPALLVEAGGLETRCIGSTGHASLMVRDNDTGPDDANHGRDGIVVSSSKAFASRASIYDIAPFVREKLAA